MARLVCICAGMLLLASQAFSMNRAVSTFGRPLVTNNVFQSSLKNYSTGIKANEPNSGQLFVSGLRQLVASKGDKDDGMRKIRAAAEENNGYALYLLSILTRDAHEAKNLAAKAAELGVDDDAYTLRESYLLHDTLPEQDD